MDGWGKSIYRGLDDKNVSSIEFVYENTFLLEQPELLNVISS